METNSQGYSGAAEGQQWHDDSSVPGVVSDFEETWADAAYLNALESRLRDAEAALREIEELIYEWPHSAQDIAGIAGRTLRAAHPEANP